VLRVIEPRDVVLGVADRAQREQHRNQRRREQRQHQREREHDASCGGSSRSGGWRHALRLPVAATPVDSLAVTERVTVLSCCAVVLLDTSDEVAAISA
jgi:hypothetical protein